MARSGIVPDVAFNLASEGPPRVRAEMERARRQGICIGRPRVTDRRGFAQRFGAVLERLGRGEISRRQAAKELGIGCATFKRLMDAQHAPEGAA